MDQHCIFSLALQSIYNGLDLSNEKNHFRSVCTLMLPELFNDVTDHKSRSGLKYIYKYIPIKLEGDPLTLSIVQGTQWNTSNLIGLG